MGMIFDPYTPTLCKWVYKREGVWYNYFSTHTHTHSSFWVCVLWFLSVWTQGSDWRHCDTCLKVDIILVNMQNFHCIYYNTTFSFLYVCLLLNYQCLEACKQHREKYRKMDLLSYSWASSISCYGSVWKGNQIPPSDQSTPSWSSTLLLSLYTKDGREGVTQDGTTRWGSWTTPFSQTASECINWPFQVIEVSHFTPKKQSGKKLCLSSVWIGSTWVFRPWFICWVHPTLWWTGGILVIMQLCYYSHLLPYRNT